VTAGTVFDRSRISLQDWFAAAWYMTNQKHGVSALGLQRLLGLGSYQFAWTILQKLRTAMVRPGRDRLRGAVEVDESYVGGIEQGVRGRGTNKKFIVGIAIEMLSPKGFGRVRLRRIRDVSGDSLVPFVCDAVEPGAVVRSDGGEVTTTFLNMDTGTSQSSFPAPEIQHTFPCRESMASLRCSNVGCLAPIRDRSQQRIWTPISTNLPSDSIVVTPAAGVCSSIDFCNTLSSPALPAIDHHAVTSLSTTGRGYCT